MAKTANRLVAVGAVVKAVRTAMRPGGPSLGERATAVPRLVRAVVAGDYVGVSKGRLLLLLAAAGYVVSPVDLMPEGVLGVLGMADDAMVLGWLATQLVEETEAFLAWERGRGQGPSASGRTVPGDVVR
ncbi:YkvA family protein [Oryzobacter sp. R7]|uniref:YkvA family protein n=1 Tax=Oryzobacter faecalis TaxID=3388656 RepID=UPI00398D3AE5